MYAFRKPVTAATYEDMSGWESGLEFKLALVLTHMAGYAVSKFIGIRLVSEHSHGHAGKAILALIGLSWLMLIGFALVPAPYNLVCIFLSAMPLGMVWGFVFSFLEGRKTTETLAAILCASFILSSGAVKSVGAWLIYSHGIADHWMPALTGLIFMPLLAGSVYMLSRIPPPSEDDKLERAERLPMTAAQRRAMVRQYGWGLVMLIGLSVLLTGYRDIRDNFTPEIWRDLGMENVVAAFTLSEIPIAVIVLISLGFLSLFRNNVRAFGVITAMIAGGCLLIGVSTLALDAGLIGPMTWMISSGAGLYLAYVPFGSMLFDRLIAMTQGTGNAGFLVYLVDAIGYLGSFGLLVLKQGLTANGNWLSFIMMAAYFVSISGAILALASYHWFKPAKAHEGAVVSGVAS